MRTKRTISNISYNSTEFFEKTIRRLEASGVIDWAYWIHHEPDIDENKPHIHLVLTPSTSINTQALGKEFAEFDPTHPTKPLGVTKVWRYTTSMDDWLLYCVHDRAYLASKGQKRNIAYKFEDYRTTDEDALRQDWFSIDRRKFDRLDEVLQAVVDGKPFALLVQEGVVPIAQRMQFQFQYQALQELMYRESSGRNISHEEEFAGEESQTPAGFLPADDIPF